jgi:hypothetical protein
MGLTKISGADTPLTVTEVSANVTGKGTDEADVRAPNPVPKTVASDPAETGAPATNEASLSTEVMVGGGGGGVCAVIFN